MRIFYLAHDNDRPNGGMRTAYTHVAALQRHGFDAAVLHRTTGFRQTWLPVDVPIVYADAVSALRPADVVVVPETFEGGLGWAARRGARRIAFCQNHYYATGMIDRHGDWRQWGCETILCSSRTIALFMRDVFGWPEPAVVPYSIDGGRFRPRAKSPSIACVPRKRQLEASLIRVLFRRRFPRHDDVPFRSIEGASEDEMAAALGEAAVFLSLAWYEGLGLTALEAMACGAVVVGFHGFGGRDYATSANGHWVEEGECERCVDLLGQVLDRVKAGDPAIDAMRRVAAATAAAYSPAAMEAALVDFWRGMSARA